MSDAANLSDFLNLFILSAVKDAYYQVSKDGKALIKQEMSALSVLYARYVAPKDELVSADQIAAELAYPLDLFIEKRRFDPQGKNIFYYYVYAFEDYTLFQPRIPQMFSEKLRLMEENGILAELVIFDLKSGTYHTVSGRNLHDKKLRAVSDRVAPMGAVTPAERIIYMNQFRQELAETRRNFQSQQKRSAFHPVWFLIAVNVAVFFAGLFLQRRYGADFLQEWGIQDNDLIRKGEVWRLFTSMFLHADITHLSGNMFSLYYLGTIIRRYYSDSEFWMIYLISGLAGNLLSFFFTDYLSLGASGAIMGLGGVLIYRMFFDREAKRFRHMGNYLMFGFMVLFNLFYGIFSEANIDNYGHFGGFFAGLLLAWLLYRAKKNA